MVKSTLVGGIVSNLLLVLGMSFLVGAISTGRRQSFSKRFLDEDMGALFLGCLGVLVPTAMASAGSSALLPAQLELTESRMTAVLLLAVYASFLAYDHSPPPPPPPPRCGAMEEEWPLRDSSKREFFVRAGSGKAVTGLEARRALSHAEGGALSHSAGVDVGATADSLPLPDKSTVVGDLEAGVSRPPAVRPASAEPVGTASVEPGTAPGRSKSMSSTRLQDSAADLDAAEKERKGTKRTPFRSRSSHNIAFGMPLFEISCDNGDDQISLLTLVVLFSLAFVLMLFLANALIGSLYSLSFSVGFGVSWLGLPVDFVAFVLLPLRAPAPQPPSRPLRPWSFYKEAWKLANRCLRRPSCVSLYQLETSVCFRRHSAPRTMTTSISLSRWPWALPRSTGCCCCPLP